MKLKSLEAGRGVAATAVVLHHASASANAFSGQGPQALTSIFDLGYLGVDFFFVLSGFIIYYSSHDRAFAPKRFVTGRLTRIFLPYLPIGIALAVAYSVLPELSASNREWGWWATATLAPSWQPPALSVAWTLQHELVFYALFAVFLAFNRIGIGMILWALAIGLIVLMDIDIPRPAQFFFSLINLEFGMGVLAAHCLISGTRIPYLPTLATIPIVAFFFMGADREYSVLFGAGLAGLILWIAQVEKAELLKVPRAFVFLGASSYSLYLIHNPLLSITSRIVSGWALTLIFGVVVSLLAGAAYYLIWDKRTQQLFRRQRNPI
ncbi:acyltransferase [Sulfitobacter sp. F26169L]|uniref:acyltransferase family protein n=1 Tax=Sulfitobacter sp. F26169L TaxID=2996015 RepID=UPI002260ABB8|nr:acyltransferase [Sulfitobacter sp. F26169L]MCX7568211.1 acyltransferase [Sulfitobacter sp. F26169L]